MSNQAAIATSPSIDETLVSILIYNYRSDLLEECLESIFNQSDLRHFEVIVCDDAGPDSTWEVARRYALLHDGRITISRNGVSLGKTGNREKALQMCRGKFTVELTDAAEFISGYVRLSLERMMADTYLEHSYISRVKPSNFFLPLRKKQEREIKTQADSRPLVSVCIYNYNYGRYLRECLESVSAQTYDNIEICFSDNASTDESWELATEFAATHPGTMSLSRNRINFGPNINLWNCVLNVRGKYILKLCSDDAMHPEFIERCVIALEQHPEASFAMVHREVIDEHGNSFPEPAFYDQSCLIPGAEQAAVYMMSSVNPSISQVIYNYSRLEGKRMAGNLNDRWFGDRIVDFHICCDSSIVYLKEPLLRNRVHDASDGARLSGNLLQCMSEFVLLHQLSDIAGNYPGMDKASQRLSPAIEKLAKLCLRYCLRALADGDHELGLRYFHLARAISLEIENDPAFKTLASYWDASPEQRHTLLQQMSAVDNLVKRTVSYPPPPGSVPLDTLFRGAFALETSALAE